MRFAWVLAVLLLVGVAAGHFTHHPAHERAAAEARLLLASHSNLVDVAVNDTINQTGWVGLRIRRTSAAPSIPHDHGAVWYAAGFGEGAALQTRIHQHWINTVKPVPNAQLAPEVRTWIETHIAFMQDRVAMLNSTDPWWKFVGLHLMQLQGLADGYASVAPAGEELTFFDIFVFNFQMELGDVATATQATQPEVSYNYVRGGCTTFIKPTADDLFFMHTTWTEYPTMLRVFRDIDLGNLRIAFSGYPGIIASNDDFYTLSNNMTVAETTELLWDNEIFRRFTIPQSVSEFLRVMVAHHVAVDGVSWVNAFSRYNSGTYNNMYMVLDLNKYSAGTPASGLQDGLLWIVEQLPGMTPKADVTKHMRELGYWASYNRAFFGVTYNVSGMRRMVEADGEYFTYDKSPRAQILARLNAGGLSSLRDMQYLMRFNEWETDPLSICPGCENPRHNPMYAIGARGDLVPHGPNTSLGVLAHTGLIGPTMTLGATDAKITSYSRVMGNFSASIISGPTTQSQPPFRWSTSWILANLPPSKTSHVGQPDLQAFDWIESNALHDDASHQKQR